MSFFENAKHVNVTGATQIAAAAGSSVTITNLGGQAGNGIALDKLSAAAAHSAMHDSSARFNAPRCHKNTRTTYLNAFEQWMLGLGGDYDSKRLIWLNGGAGAGKSAIMQSTIERCIVHTVILGTFFFCRTDSSRNHAEILIPTLAYQLACNFPSVMDVLEHCIQHNPGIFETSLLTQAHELLVRPLLYLVETGIIDSISPLRRVFVIDGLDECHNAEKQAHIIHVIATILCNREIPVSFLVASRPEVAINRAFHGEKRLHAIFSSVTLDDNAEATADIRQFIEDSFLDIVDVHPLRAHIPLNWPHPSDIDQLVEKSSGHFIHAATVMKFLSSSDEHPSRALEVVKGLVPSRVGNPFAELDALYLHILTSAKYSVQVLEILRFCSFLLLENSITAICYMYPKISPEDVELFLSDVHALVSLSPNENADMHISLRHASLRDFFADASRSHSVYTNREDYLASLLPRYFSLLDDGCQFLLSPPSIYSGIILELISAILNSKNIAQLQSLIDVYTPQHVWMFCLRYNGAEHSFDNCPNAMSMALISQYMHVIRDSAANHENALYTLHFKSFIRVLIEDISDIAETEPHYKIIPALIFSSSLSCLTTAAYHLVLCFPKVINSVYGSIFMDMSPRDDQLQTLHFGVTDPRSYEAIRSSPQAHISWGSDLANGLELVLQHLGEYTWTPECLCPNPHKQWLNKTKPFKHVSQGSPKLSSAFYSYLDTLPTPQPIGDNGIAALEHHLLSQEEAWNICNRRVQCYVYLQSVIHYLHKCDSTSALAKLARRSLPKAALWFPKMMKKARKAMDAYVRRWEESLDGLLERAQLLTINEMD